MVELIAETDEGLMERYLEDDTISTPELKAALRAATLAGTLVPVLCGSALKNKGVQRMLDAVIDYLPSPLDVPPVEGVNPKTEEPEIRTVAAGPAFFRSRLQDPGRSARWQTGLYPHLFGQHGIG